MNPATQLFGQTDIYLVDQILKGTYDNCHEVLEVGCGSGRNLFYFLKNGFNVSGIDINPIAIENCKQLAMTMSSSNDLTYFKEEDICENKLPGESFDLVISNAVFHFANDQKHFESMLLSAWKLVKPNGFMFCRLASNIGIEGLVEKLDNEKYHLPDGSERFLVDQQMLIDYSAKLGGQLHENIKTTNVQNLRCMTTWCLRKMPI